MDNIVIGGSGTIGSAVVRGLAGRHRVINASRTGQEAVDITSADSLRRPFERTGRVDAVVCIAGEAVFKPLPDFTDDDRELGLRSKLVGQFNVVRVGLDHVRDGGSITLTSGVTARQPIPVATRTARSTRPSRASSAGQRWTCHGRVR